MAPVDGIRAPNPRAKKKKSASESKRTVIRTIPTRQKDTDGKNKRELKTKLPQGIPPRVLGLWIIVSVIMIFIIASWIFLFQGGKLVKPSESERIIHLSDKVSSVWESIKSDIFQIQEAVNKEVTGKNAEDEIIRDLRERIFPELLNKEGVTNVNKAAESNVEATNNNAGTE